MLTAVPTELVPIAPAFKQGPEALYSQVQPPQGLSTTTPKTAKAACPSEAERNLRKRIAARVRQQRCRARKREAKLAKAQKDAKVARPSVVNQHVVRGPVLIRSPPRMTMPLMHHPTSPFIMYPRRTPSLFPPTPPGNMWARSQMQQPRSPPISSPPITSLPFHGSMPLHHELMKGTAFNLRLCRSPTATHLMRVPPPSLHIPRVSPVTETVIKKVPKMPELLDRKEETAIDAMLSLCRSPSSKSNEEVATVTVGV